MDIIGTLSISVRTLRGYLEDIKEKEEEERNQRILDMYLASCTQQEIADDVGLERSTITKEITKLIDNVKNGKLAEIHQSPESLQITNLCYSDHGSGEDIVTA